MDICSIYRKLLDKWLRTIQKYNDRTTDMFEYFQKGLLTTTQINITYDETITLIIKERIDKMNLNSIGKAVNCQNSQILNDYLLITKSLYENLFINGRDVAFIIQKIPIDLEQIMKFVNSCDGPIEERWKNYIPFPMNIFWFIIPFKGIDQSLQILIYETTKFCHIMEKEKQIEDYIAYLKKHSHLEETALKWSTLLQSHLYRSFQKNSTAADSQIQLSSAQMPDIPSISSIQYRDYQDSFQLSF